MLKNEDGAGGGASPASVSIDLSELEPIHAGPRHRLYRGRSAQRAIVVRTPAGDAASARGRLDPEQM